MVFRPMLPRGLDDVFHLVGASELNMMKLLRAIVVLLCMIDPAFAWDEDPATPLPTQKDGYAIT